MLAVWTTADAGALSDSDLMVVHERYCRMRRMLDADQAALAAEIARRSRPELGPDSLAKTQGYRNPTALIAATAGTSTGDAARLVKVGEATAPRQLLSGQQAPARHPHVAAGLSAAVLTEGRRGRSSPCWTGSRSAPGPKPSTLRSGPWWRRRPG